MQEQVGFGVFPFNESLPLVENTDVFFRACAVVDLDFLGEGGWQGAIFQVRNIVLHMWEADTWIVSVVLELKF